MSFLLDTNVCIEILRGRNPTLHFRYPPQFSFGTIRCAIMPYACWLISLFHG